MKDVRDLTENINTELVNQGEAIDTAKKNMNHGNEITEKVVQELQMMTEK